MVIGSIYIDVFGAFMASCIFTWSVLPLERRNSVPTSLQVPVGAAIDSAHWGFIVTSDQSNVDEDKEGTPALKLSWSLHSGTGLGRRKRCYSSKLPQYFSSRIVNMSGPVQSIYLAFNGLVEVINDVQKNIKTN